MTMSHELWQNNGKATNWKVKNIIQTSYLTTYEQIKSFSSHLKLNRLIEAALYLQLRSR